MADAAGATSSGGMSSNSGGEVGAGSASGGASEPKNIREGGFLRAKKPPQEKSVSLSPKVKVSPGKTPPPPQEIRPLDSASSPGAQRSIDEGAAGDDAASEFEKFLLQEAGEAGEKNAKPEDPDFETPEDLDEKSKASERFHKLVDRAKKAEATANENQNMAYQFYNRVQQMERQFGQFASALKTENAQLKATLGAVRQQMQQQPQGRQDPEKILQNEMYSRIDKLVQQRVAPVQQQNQQLRQYMAQQQQAVQMNQTKARISAEADKVVQEVVLANGKWDEQQKQTLAPNLKRWLFAIAMDSASSGRQMSLADAGLQLKRTVAALSLGHLRGRTSANQETKQRASDASPVVRGSGGGEHARGKGDPDMRTLRYNGFKDVPDWEINGKRAPLKTPPQGYDW